jgi:hypothetical protein
VQVFIELKIPQPVCGRWHCAPEGGLGCNAERCDEGEDALASNLEFPTSLYSAQEPNRENHEGEATVSLWSPPAFDQVRLCDQAQAQSAPPLKSTKDVIDFLRTLRDVELTKVREEIDALIASRRDGQIG